MQNHPLTPMTDPDIRRWLSTQTRHAVGHVAIDDVMGGADRVAAAVAREVDAGRAVVVVDAIADTDLRTIGRAVASLGLVTGGSGIAIGLPAALGADRQQTDAQHAWTGQPGPGVVLSGSCSAATLEQVSKYAASHPHLTVEPARVVTGAQTVETVAAWLLDHLDDEPIASSTADPRAVTDAQASHGREETAAALEHLFADVAVALCDAGVQRLVVAGGETSGAVTEALGIEAFEIGPEIAPGVPAMAATNGGLCVALKSGNFGGPSFFEDALGILKGRL